MEREHAPRSPNRPTLRLQATPIPGSAAPSLSPSFKLDEGYSDETRSQSDKDPVPDNTMMLPDWVLAQSETDRAGQSSSPRPAPANLYPQPPLVYPPADRGNHLIFRTCIQFTPILVCPHARHDG